MYFLHLFVVVDVEPMASCELVRYCFWTLSPASLSISSSQFLLYCELLCVCICTQENAMCGQRQLMSVFPLHPVASQDSIWVIRPSSRCAFSCWHPKSFYLSIFKIFFEIKLLRWKHWSLLGLYQAVLDLQTLHIASQNRITQLPWRRALPCFLLVPFY